MTSELSVRATSLEESARRSRAWLLEVAAPRWSTIGRTASGLFPERMTLAGEPDASYFRTFVQARHIFSFLTIGGLGWKGPWRELVGESMNVLVNSARRADGLYVHRLDRNARPLDTRADLYDQAFVLLALGTAGGALGREDWFDEAEALLELLSATWKHPLGGFREGEIANARVRRQNPHMHLLEAFLALHEASGRLPFLHAADTIAELACEKFIDGRTGALLEYFTDELEPAAGVEGRIVEPGHCCEWAWLFERLGERGRTDASSVSDRLTTFARSFGVDGQRDVMINEVLTDGTSHDLKARLWPQTERLKAAVARLRRLRTNQEADEAAAAARGLQLYLEVRTPGLWRDKLREDGRWVDELAPGSSLYHLSCAYAELQSVIDPNGDLR